jgi:hypothetical protein
MRPAEFRLNEFKQLAKEVWRLLPAPLAFFLTGWLYGFESLYIDAKISTTLDRAEREYHELTEAPEGLTEPIYYTEPSEVEGLDTIGIKRTRREDQE